MTRVCLFACVVVACLAAAASSNACECIDRLMPWNWGDRGATTYAPPYYPGATATTSYVPATTGGCNTCAVAAPCATQTCCYVPQTCYRTVSGVTPVTTCRPVTSYDPCSGCPVTTYRQVTSYERCTQLIPYTTYRVVWSNPCATTCSPCATSCGSSCGLGCGASPTVRSGCSSCATPSYTNSTTTPQPIPTTGSTPSTFVAPPTTNPPAANQNSQNQNQSWTQWNQTPAASNSRQQGFQQQQQQQQKVQKPAIDETEMKPIPDPDVQPGSSKGPTLFNPSDKTAFQPVRQVVYVSEVPAAPSRSTASPLKAAGPMDTTPWQSVNP